MRHILLLSLGLVLCGGAPAAAQEVALEPGARVRVRDRTAETYVGRFAAARDDTVWIATGRPAPGATETRLGIPVGQVHRLERSAGRRRHVARNGGIGLLVGVAAGLVATAATIDEEFGFIFASPYEFGAFVAVGVGVPAGVLGGLTGLIPTERWERVPLPAAPVAGAGLSVRPKVGTTRVPVRGAPPARALTLGVTLRPR